MILWLASYPRSGNTYARLLLHHAYGLETYSVYAGSPQYAGIRQLIGERELPMPLPTLAEADELYVIKTHEMPGDDWPAIYLARDGRDALVSYAFFYLADHPDADFETILQEMITHPGFFGGWSAHVLRWMRRDAPTAMITFENLIQAEQPIRLIRAALLRLGARLPDEMTHQTSPSFAELHNAHPQFFRRGGIGDWAVHMSPRLHELFWQHHREAMEALGYIREAMKGA